MDAYQRGFLPVPDSGRGLNELLDRIHNPDMSFKKRIPGSVRLHVLFVSDPQGLYVLLGLGEAGDPSPRGIRI